MSIQNPNGHDLYRAALTGMGNFDGDPEVAEDLGIPVTEETLGNHLRSARRAKAIGATGLTPVRISPRAATAPDAAEHAALGPVPPEIVR